MEQIQMTDENQQIIDEYFESKERARHAKDRFKFIIEERIVKRTAEDNGGKPFQLTPKIKVTPVTGGDYFVKKPGITMDMIVSKNPDLWEKRTRANSFRYTEAE